MKMLDSKFYYFIARGQVHSPEKERVRQKERERERKHPLVGCGHTTSPAHQDLGHAHTQVQHVFQTTRANSQP